MLLGSVTRLERSKWFTFFALNQLQYLLQVGEHTETMLEMLLLRLNEQGLEVWVVNAEQSLVEMLWPRLHQA